MTLSELIAKISNASVGNIEVQHQSMRHGNQGGAGDYRRVVLKVATEELIFKETASGWQQEEA